MRLHGLGSTPTLIINSPSLALPVPLNGARDFAYQALWRLNFYYFGVCVHVHVHVCVEGRVVDSLSQVHVAKEYLAYDYEYITKRGEIT